MNIELGGFKRKGWVTMNMEKADIIHDLNVFPYPIPDNKADSVMMLHTIEHLADPFRVMQEVYRIAKHDSLVYIEVPYWKKDMWTNPVHKHYFKPQWFSSLTPRSRKFLNMESWCPCDFVALKTKWIRGKHAFWRKYALQVVLKVNKT